MTIEELAAYGANVEEGLGRCMDNEGLYLMLVGTIKDESGFDTLSNAIAENDLQTAFEAAHSLKGILGNLAITPLYEPVQEITELLRARTKMDYSQLLTEISSKKDELCALL